MKTKYMKDKHTSSVFKMLALGFILANAPAMAQDQAAADDDAAEAESVMEEVIVEAASVELRVLVIRVSVVADLIF